ncbi:MAG TPA: hypothetical protein VFF76_10950 [Holophagaceae bacterium]|jgi:hypothetical protein|nr:hypothetical protein [Holophagaceae bacterium]
MFLPPALQQPAPSQPSAQKAEPGPFASLLQKRGAVLSLKRHPVGALYGRGTVEIETLEASDGTDTRQGLGFHVAGPAPNDGEGRVLLETAEIPTLLAALDRFQSEAPKLGSSDAETSFTYTSTSGLTLELARSRQGVAFTLRAGRGEAILAVNQIAALKQLVEKAK